MYTTIELTSNREHYSKLNIFAALSGRYCYKFERKIGA